MSQLKHPSGSHPTARIHFSEWRGSMKKAVAALGLLSAIASTGTMAAITVEAETMTRSGGYTADGSLIKVSSGTTGTVTHTFTGPAGVYNIQVMVELEADGKPNLKLYKGSTLLKDYTYPLGANGDPAVVTQDNVTLVSGDTIRLVGTLDEGALARVDKMVLTQVGGLPTATPAPAPAPAAPAYTGTPYTGTPIPLPAAFAAKNFDKGGEGVAFRDLTPGNAGGQFRTSEGVDIVVSLDPQGGGHDINNFQTGEWMAYTVNVPVAGKYDISIRAAHNYATTPAFRIEVDGVNVTGSVAVPKTGGWGSFQWVGKQGVQLAAGKHVLKVVSEKEFFNLNTISVLASAGTLTPPPTPAPPAQTQTPTPTPTSTPTPTPAPAPLPAAPAGSVKWSCDFENTTCGMGEHSKTEPTPRSTYVANARTGSRGISLNTRPGDNNVHGSGDWERNDLILGASSEYCNQGQTEWWAHSVMFPDNFVFPPSGGIVMDFHHNASSGQANFEIQTMAGIGIRARGYGGGSINSGMYQSVFPDPYGAPAGSVTKNRWYDFVYNVKWSSGSDGFMIAWLNGKKVMNYKGPTLYSGISCYLKLANYHAPLGTASSVIHDRVIRGTSAAAVALTPLE
jgi:hypothetical protein